MDDKLDTPPGIPSGLIVFSACGVLCFGDWEVKGKGLRVKGGAVQASYPTLVRAVTKWAFRGQVSYGQLAISLYSFFIFPFSSPPYRPPDNS